LVLQSKVLGHKLKRTESGVEVLDEGVFDGLPGPDELQGDAALGPLSQTVLRGSPRSLPGGRALTSGAQRRQRMADFDLGDLARDTALYVARRSMVGRL
jgi:hypothetical protein